MTNQEAISVLESINAKTDYFLINDDARAEAIDIAISALQEQDLQQNCNQLATDLISRQAAIDAINNIMPTKEGLYEPSEVLWALMKLPSAQPEPPEDICGECDAWNKYKSENKTGRWISCSERLPDNGRVVLWCNEHGSVFTSAITVRVGKSWAIGKKHRLSEIVAWMPLPEPYRAERRIDERTD